MCPRLGGPGGDVDEVEAQRRAAGLAVGETGQGSDGAQQVMGDRVLMLGRLRSAGSAGMCMRALTCCPLE
jgi:hypothetical protein